MSLWLSKKVLTALVEQLAASGDGLVATEHLPRIHRALAGERRVCLWSDGNTGLAALVVGDFAKGEDWLDRAAHWSASLACGGLLVSVERAPAYEVSRRLLCSGFTDIAQTRAGRYVVSCGRLVS